MAQNYNVVHGTTQTLYATAADYAALNTQGIPVKAGTIIIDPTSTPNVVLGISDGSGGLFTGGVAGAAQGLAAARPAASAGNNGLIYYSSDTGALEQSNGVSWVNLNTGVPLSTWAARGTATLGTMKIITDVGTGYSLFMGDGTNYRPQNGRLCIAQASGTIAVPIASISASTSSLFTLTTPIVIPAGLIVPNSTVYTSALIRRTGANATANARSFLGTAGTTGDSVLGQLSLAATTLLNGDLESFGYFGTGTTTYVATGTLPPMGTSTTGTVADNTTNVNTALAMTLSFGVTNANVGDSFDLVRYAVWLLT